MISIIVAMYNVEKYISRCINSLINQTYKDIEIIIVDDGSTDNSNKICSEIVDSRIKIIEKKNGGVASARNLGLDNCHGDYVLFVDADDWLEPTACEKFHKCLLENKNDAIICMYNEFYEKEKKFVPFYARNYENKDFMELISNKKYNIHGFVWNKLLKRECITNKFNEKIHIMEDLIFLLDNSNSIKNVFVINEPLYNYSINNVSVIHNEKINERTLTKFEAINEIVNRIPNKNTYGFKLDYFNSFYRFKVQLSKTDYKKYLFKYEENCNKYYKELIRQSSFKMKIKLYLKKHFINIYKFFRKIKTH